jgi:hypothetical protein
MTGLVQHSYRAAAVAPVHTGSPSATGIARGG